MHPNLQISKIMAYTRMTAAEAAALIKNGENIAMSGFTPAGVAKATTKELAKIAVAEHEAGREFKVGPPVDCGNQAFAAWQRLADHPLQLRQRFRAHHVAT